MPFLDEKINYDNAKLDITYVTRNFTLSDLLTRHEFETLSQDEIHVRITRRIRLLTKVKEVSVLVQV